MIQMAPWLALGWLAGTGLQLQQAHFWPFKFVALGLAMSCLLLGMAWLAYLVKKTRYRETKAMRAGRGALMWAKLLPGLLSLAACLLALSVVNARALYQAHDALLPQLEGQDLRVTGEVMSLPQKGSLGVRFQFHVVSAQRLNRDEEVQVPSRIAMSWYTGEAADPLDSAPSAELMAGDRWQMTVRLKAPHGHLNPHGFDEELWLWEQGVMATGTVRAGKRDAVPRKLSGSWRYPVALLRQKVRDRIDQQRVGFDVQGHNAMGVISALVMGDQSAIADSDWGVFRTTGVAHLMSISGLHISLFAWLASHLILLLWRILARRGYPQCLAYPAPVIAALGGLCCATAYALFSGWGLPAQRTIVMLCAMTLLKLLGARWSWQWVWGFALCCAAVWDPWALMQAGFWLSFVAVGVLWVTTFDLDEVCTKLEVKGSEMVRQTSFVKNCLNMVKSIKDLILKLVREQWVMSLALSPLMVLFFGQVSWVGMLANLVAIPWVTWVVTPLAMLGLIWPGFWQVSLWALEPLLTLLYGLAQVPAGVWYLPRPPWLLGVAAVWGGLMLLQKWPWHLRVWGLLLWLPIFLWQSPKPAWGQFEVWAADVGQGNAVILRTAHHALLYDTGARYSETSDAGQRVLVPLLSSLGIQLDRLMLSHRDLDHTGGARSVLLAHPQADLWTSIEQSHPLASLRSITRCEAGQTWDWDGVHFEVLHPSARDYEAALSSNAVSCVLRVDASQASGSSVGHDRTGGSALLNGDIEAPQEGRLFEQNVLKPVDFFLVPHHGSQTSSTMAFVQASRPQWAVVQAGYLNRYGHPAVKVVERYASLRVPLVQTSQCGAAYWQSQAPHVLTCERNLARRYWHAVAQ
jgi:competence protein ComEC